MIHTSITPADIYPTSCELGGAVLLTLDAGAVKNIVLTGFGQITLLDLDTIDLSNLNRQFLFKKKDIKQSKALVCDASAPLVVLNAER